MERCRKRRQSISSKLTHRPRMNTRRFLHRRRQTLEKQLYENVNYHSYLQRKRESPFSYEGDILIVDDNSPDGTGKLADELHEQDPRIHVLHRSGKLGLGTAYIAGFKYAVAHNY